MARLDEIEKNVGLNTQARLDSKFHDEFQIVDALSVLSPDTAIYMSSKDINKTVIITVSEFLKKFSSEDYSLIPSDENGDLVFIQSGNPDFSFTIYRSDWAIASSDLPIKKGKWRISENQVSSSFSLDLKNEESAVISDPQNSTFGKNIFFGEDTDTFTDLSGSQVVGKFKFDSPRLGIEISRVSEGNYLIHRKSKPISVDSTNSSTALSEIAEIEGFKIKETVSELLSITKQGTSSFRISFRGENGNTQTQDFDISEILPPVISDGDDFDASTLIFSFKNDDGTTGTFDFRTLKLITTTSANGVIEVNQLNSGTNFSVSKIGQTGDFSDVLSEMSKSVNLENKSGENIDFSIFLRGTGINVVVFELKNGEVDIVGTVSTKINGGRSSIDLSNDGYEITLPLPISGMASGIFGNNTYSVQLRTRGVLDGTAQLGYVPVLKSISGADKGAIEWEPIPSPATENITLTLINGWAGSVTASKYGNVVTIYGYNMKKPAFASLPSVFASLPSGFISGKVVVWSGIQAVINTAGAYTNDVMVGSISTTGNISGLNATDLSKLYNFTITFVI